MTLQVTQAAIVEMMRLSQHRQGGSRSEVSAASGETMAKLIQAQLDFGPGGCAGQRYQLNFDIALPGSQIVECGAVALHVSEVAWPHVQQLTLDYVEDLMGGSFRFDNPQLPDTCNCGQSFRLGLQP